MKHTVREVELKNGAKGLVIDVPNTDVVNFLIEFRAGFDVGDWQKYEIPHVMEHTMFTNKHYPKPRQFSKEVEKNGAFNNAYTSSSSLEYEYECAEFEAERIAKLIASQISAPLFPEREVKTEIGNVGEELSNYLSNHQQVCFDNLVQASQDRTSLKERLQQLSTITRADLLKFYLQTHTGGNMRFIIAGHTNFERLVKIIDTPLKQGKRLKLPKIPTKHLLKPLAETRPIDQIYYSLFTAHDHKLEYRELVAARIISNILTNGFSSTLFGLAREKGLIYGVGMGINSSLYDSGLRMSGFVTPKNAKEFFKLAQTEIKKVQNGQFTDAQFKAFTTLMAGERARTYQRVGNLTSYYDDYFEDDSFEPFEHFYDLMQEITKKEAVEQFNRLFAEKRWGISYVGDIEIGAATEFNELIAPLWKA